MASLNGVTPGGWISYAQLLEQAGADGLELHLYHAASDTTTSAADVEKQAIDIVRDVKRSLRIPVAVKLAPLLTAFAHFAKQLDTAGADAFVLFTRFHRVDIDVTELEVIRTLPLSDSSELPLRLRGVAALAGRVKASLCDHGRHSYRTRRHQGHDGRRPRDTDGFGASSKRSRSSPPGAERDRVVDAGERMELARRDAGQHELPADSRSGCARTRELPHGTQMTADIGYFTTARHAARGPGAREVHRVQPSLPSCDLLFFSQSSRLAPPVGFLTVRRTRGDRRGRRDCPANSRPKNLGVLSDLGG